MIRVTGSEPEYLVASCRECGAQLEFTHDEVRERHGTDISGGPDGAQWVVCPRCHSDVVIRRW